MIKHMVMWTIKEVEGRSKDESISLIKAELEKLPDLIPEIQFFEVGLNITDSDAAYDIGILSHFKSREDLKIYRDHPEHVKAAKFVSSIRDKRAVLDYEI